MFAKLFCETSNARISANIADSDLFLFLFDCKFYLQQKSAWFVFVYDEPFLRYSTLKLMCYVRKLKRTAYVARCLRVNEKCQISQKSKKNIKTQKIPLK